MEQPQQTTTQSMTSTTQMPTASTTPMPTSPTNSSTTSTTVVSSNPKSPTKLMIALVFIFVVMIFVVAILYFLWQEQIGNQPAQDKLAPVSSAQTYEPQNLNFDNADGSSTVDKVINDTDKSMVTTTNDSNFKDLDLQNDFQIK